MEYFIKVFNDIWKCEIKSMFEKGIIAYERQLQVMLYRYLKEKLSCDYEIFIEPVIYDLEKTKPDMVITRGREIIGIIELKCKP